MANRPGWYPPGQVCSPPELPAYLKSVHDLKPIIGVPSDEEVMGIHAVIHAANRTSGIPAMNDPGLLVGLADHLFSAQMGTEASIRSLYFRAQDATYTPPVLPSQLSVKLEPVSGTPSDDQIMKVQDAIQTYQELRRIPAMFDTHVNMELSQHLFDIQMARYMRRAGENEPNVVSASPRIPFPTAEPVPTTTNEFERATSTNNAGTGADVARVHQVSQPALGVDTLMERANRLAERFNVLLERSNELAGRSTQPVQQPNSLDERFNQVLERLSQLVEMSNQPVQQLNKHTERFNQLAEKANEITERLAVSSERSNQLAEQCNKYMGCMGEVIGNINRVLVGIQHAVVRSHKNNTIDAIDCLVNETGETPANNRLYKPASLAPLSRRHSDPPASDNRLPVTINGNSHNLYIPDKGLGFFLLLYGIDEGLCQTGTVQLIAGKEAVARRLLSRYLSSCLG